MRSPDLQEDFLHICTNIQNGTAGVYIHICLYMSIMTPVPAEGAWTTFRRRYRLLYGTSKSNAKTKPKP